MNIRTSTLITGCIAVFLCSFAFIMNTPTAAQSDPESEMLSRQVTISVSQVRVGRTASRLANSTGIKVNVEEARRSPLPGDPPETIIDIVQRRDEGISIDMVDATVEQVLNELMAVDDRYEYTVDVEAETINMYPKDDAPLGWMTGVLNIVDKTVREILLEDDLLGLRERNILFWPRGNMSWSETRVTLQSGPMTARDALNALCAQLPFKARWETQDGSVWKTGDVAHALLIHGVSGRGPK